MLLRLDPLSPSGVSVAQAPGAVINPPQTLTATGVAAGTYGNASQVGQFTVGTDGRITFAQNVDIVSTDINNLFATMVKLGLGS